MDLGEEKCLVLFSVKKNVDVYKRQERNVARKKMTVRKG